MGTEFTFYDYKEGDDNLIRSWMNSRDVPKGAKQKLNRRLLHLEALPKGEWKRPFVDTLTGVCDGLFELRASLGGIQYRLLGHHGPGGKTPTLLHGFIKEDDKISERDCDIARARLERVYGDTDKSREIHRYD